MTNKIDTVIFDLGGVLIDWNPEHLYREVFDDDQQKMNWFLNSICTSDWNLEQDAGRTLSEGTELLVNQYPEYEDWIRIFYNRWEDMLGGVIQETADILNHIKQLNSHRLFALTNWSHETMHIPLKRYDFFHNFEGMVVSGIEKVRKPYPEIYKILLNRYSLNPESCVFIDDNYENIETANKMGITGIHFRSAPQLNEDLIGLGIYK